MRRWTERQDTDRPLCFARDAVVCQSQIIAIARTAEREWRTMPNEPKRTRGRRAVISGERAETNLKSELFIKAERTKRTKRGYTSDKRDAGFRDRSRPELR